MPTHPVATTLLPISQIHPNPDQPRKMFDPAELEELKASIQERGLINPISVKQVGEGDYLIMAGERRYKACSELGWKEIDARIWPMETTPEELELVSLVENIQRTDLNAFEKAKGYKRMQTEFNKTYQVIAKAVGIKTDEVIIRHLALLDMPQEIQDLLSRDSISERHCRTIRRLKDKAQQIAIAQQAAKEGWSVKETEKRVNQHLAGQTQGDGNKPALAPAPSWKSSDTPSFSTKGNRALIQASFDMSQSKPREFVEGLFASLMGFLAKDEVGQRHVIEWNHEESLKPSSKAGRLPAVESGKRMNLPQTPEEAAALEELAANSPGPQSFYARIYGENSALVASMAGLRWSDTPHPDPREFVRGFLKKYQNVSTQPPAAAPKPPPTAEAPPAGAPAVPSTRPMPSPPPAAPPPQPQSADPVKEEDKIDPKVQAMVDRVKARRARL